MKPRNAQIQLGESTAAIVVIIILIVLGLVFYSVLSRSNVDDKKIEIANLEAIEVASFATAIPELHCTFLGAASANCFDAVKVANFSSLLSSDTDAYLYYAEFFKNARISIEEVYPGNASWLIYENNKSVRQSELPVYIPINLYYPLDDDYSFAVLKVVKYS
ncbi:hypothetical protein C4573_01220 [Candidatus Woesearchaeota archaeon]|nr:MAG: hypothetical protein C4573_01220 [Candidatus Woesearchaeota archaeon]